MNLLLKLKVENIFKSKDFTDKASGEVTPSKWKIQTFDNIETENGEQMQLINISITDEKYYEVKEMIGSEIELPVRTFVNKGRVGFYGI